MFSGAEAVMQRLSFFWGVIEITGLRPFLFGGMLGVIEIIGLRPFMIQG